MIDSSTLKSGLFTYIKAGVCDFWTINPYPRCDHNCNYCITRAQGKSIPAFDLQDTLRRVGQALDHIPDQLTLSIGGISDGYPSSEADFKLTRSILKLLNSHNRAYSIITKGITVERDIDIIAANPRAQVVFSFSSLDEALSHKYELDAPSPVLRMRVLKKMSVKGIATSISLKPWIPGVTNIQAFLDDVPDDVKIRLERLKIIRATRRFPIEGKNFSQEEIDDLYRREHQKYAGVKQLVWQLDQAYSAQTSKELHPTLSALERNRAEFSKLLSRGKLLETPQSKATHVEC